MTRHGSEQIFYRVAMGIAILAPLVVSGCGTSSVLPPPTDLCVLSGAAAAEKEPAAAQDLKLACLLTKYSENKTPENAVPLAEAVIARAQTRANEKQMKLAVADLVSVSGLVSRLPEDKQKPLMEKMTNVWMEKDAQGKWKMRTNFAEFDKEILASADKTQREAANSIIMAPVKPQSQMNAERVWQEQKIAKNDTPEFNTWRDQIISKTIQSWKAKDDKGKDIVTLDAAFNRYKSKLTKSFGAKVLQDYSMEDFKKWVFSQSDEVSMINVPDTEIAKIFESDLADRLYALLKKDVNNEIKTPSPVSTYDLVFASLTNQEKSDLAARFGSDKISQLKSLMDDPKNQDLVKRGMAAGLARYFVNLSERQYGPESTKRVPQVVGFRAVKTDEFGKEIPGSERAFNNPLDLAELMPPTLLSAKEFEKVKFNLDANKITIKIRFPRQEKNTGENNGFAEKEYNYNFLSSESYDFVGVFLTAALQSVGFFGSGGPYALKTDLGQNQSLAYSLEMREVPPPFVPVLLVKSKSGGGLKIRVPEEVDQSPAPFKSISLSANPTFKDQLIFCDDQEIIPVPKIIPGAQDIIINNNSSVLWTLVNLAPGTVLDRLLMLFEETVTANATRIITGSQGAIENSLIYDWQKILQNQPIAVISGYAGKLFAHSLYDPTDRVLPYQPLNFEFYAQKAITDVMTQQTNIPDFLRKKLHPFLSSDSGYRAIPLFKESEGNSDFGFLLANKNKIVLRSVGNTFMTADRSQVIVVDSGPTPTEQLDSRGLEAIFFSQVAQAIVPFPLFLFFNNFNIPLPLLVYPLVEGTLFSSMRPPPTK
jgi:hypothetical protein